MHALGIGSNSNATKSGVVGVVAVEDSHKASASTIQQTAPVRPVLDDHLAHPLASLRHNKSARYLGRHGRPPARPVRDEEA